MLRQVQCLLHESAKLMTSTSIRHSISSSKVGNSEIARGGTNWAPSPQKLYFHHQRRYAFRSAWAWKGLGPGCWHAAGMGQNLADTSPSKHVPWSWSPLTGNQPQGLGLSQGGRWNSAWFAPWLLAQHCNAAFLLGTSKADMQVLAATLEKCRPCKSSGRAQQYLPATLGVNLWSRCQCCPAAERVLVPGSPLLSSVFSWFAPGAAWVSTCPALVCPVPPHQVIALTVVALNKSFSLWLRGKDWTCIALLGKKGCKQKNENSI